MRVSFAILLIIAFVAAPAQAADGATGMVVGTVTLGPTCPGPERPGQNCTAPFSGMIEIRRLSSHRLIALVHTSRQGAFTRPLAPGRYILLVRHCGMSARNEAGSPPTVRVAARRTTRTQIRCDTGVR